MFKLFLLDSLRPDGSILDRPGYDPATGLYFDAQGVAFPAIPQRPTREQARAALIVLRAYILAGRPAQPYPPMGSFEEWDATIRRALTWLGEADPLAGTAQLEDADPVRLKLRALLLLHPS